MLQLSQVTYGNGLKLRHLLAQPLTLCFRRAKFEADFTASASQSCVKASYIQGLGIHAAIDIIGFK